MSTATNVPPGMTPAMIQAALAYLLSQAQQNAPRPSGLLQAHQIRGVNPSYKYEYREYPKALTPPDIEIQNAAEERALRVKWREPLPWQANDPAGAELIRVFYEEAEYPKRVTPPQVFVADMAEEAAVRAQWQAEFGVDGGIVYPAWFFHVSKQPAMVHSAAQRDALGAGWYQTPQEAVDAAKGVQAPVQASEEIERARLLARADELGVSVDARMKTPRLRNIVDKAEEEAKAA